MRFALVPCGKRGGDGSSPLAADTDCWGRAVPNPCEPPTRVKCIAPKLNLITEHTKREPRLTNHRLGLFRVFRGLQKMKTTSLFSTLLLALAGCKPQASGPPAPASGAPKTYAVQGVVQAVAPDQRHATIKHDAIPGYMAAMTMDFSARDTNAL